MLRISSVWRIRQINFKNSLKNASILHLFYEILLGSEQLPNRYKMNLIKWEDTNFYKEGTRLYESLSS